MHNANSEDDEVEQPLCLYLGGVGCEVNDHNGAELSQSNFN